MRLHHTRKASALGTECARSACSPSFSWIGSVGLKPLGHRRLVSRRFCPRPKEDEDEYDSTLETDERCVSVCLLQSNPKASLSSSGYVSLSTISAIYLSLSPLSFIFCPCFSLSLLLLVSCWLCLLSLVTSKVGGACCFGCLNLLTVGTVVRVTDTRRGRLSFLSISKEG